MINPIGKQFYTKHPAFNSRQMQFESGSTIDIPQNSADKFLREIEIINKKRREGNFFNKYCWSTKRNTKKPTLKILRYGQV